VTKRFFHQLTESSSWSRNQCQQKTILLEVFTTYYLQGPCRFAFLIVEPPLQPVTQRSDPTVRKLGWMNRFPRGNKSAYETFSGRESDIRTRKIYFRRRVIVMMLCTRCVSVLLTPSGHPHKAGKHCLSKHTTKHGTFPLYTSSSQRFTHRSISSTASSWRARVHRYEIRTKNSVTSSTTIVPKHHEGR